MRRWHGCVALATARRPHTLCKTFIGIRQIRLASSTVNGQNEDPYYQQCAVFQKTPVPQSNRVEEWVALLDGALPPHLRDQNISPPLLTLASTDLAEVLLAAQRPTKSNRTGHDLLYHLGFEQGRWSAVVELVKKLVDRFPVPRQSGAGITDSLALWKQAPPFPTARTTFRATQTTAPQVNGDQDSFESTKGAGRAGNKAEEYPIWLELEVAPSDPNLVEAKSLDELTSSRGDYVTDQQNLAHDALGQVWRTLGAMTMACAGGNIRQEVLEIIAYLHHREIMPMSIYQYRPTIDKSAIQQPPLIPLLSSRILTSLSDAAWRAHEKLLVEEAKVRQGDRAFKDQAAVLATPYRARVDGLFPEVWLELILWSCLHGGWIKQGGRILDSIAKTARWKPLSWREYEKALPPHGQLDSNDWDAWDYLFKTKAAKSMDPPNHPIPEVRRTISAEVVNTYIDAIASLPSDTSGMHYGSMFRPMQKLLRLRSFLAKENLGLTTGSWDALVIRLLETQIEDISPVIICRFVELSPGLGQGLTSKNTQDLPAYVLDGGLAMQGILNRVFHQTVLAGNLELALKVLSIMIARTDRDKQTSLVSFLEGSKPLLRALDGNEMFTSNVTGIEYPAFDLQIPTTTLALFLDMVTEAKSYDFGRWLLYSKDADGPIIKHDMYDDPFLTPALVRFAAATQHARLFSALRALPSFSIHFVLDAQIDAMRWEAATGIVQYTIENHRLLKSHWSTWTTDNLANLTRVMLSQIPGAVSGQAESRENLLSAMRLFSIMVAQVKNTNPDFVVKVQTLLSVLSSVDASWAKFCLNLRLLSGHHDFELRTPQFNCLLEGVVSAYGSIAGRRLLTLFWPQSARRSRKGITKPAVDETGGLGAERIVVPLPGMAPEQKVVVYGALSPNWKTIVVILQKALEELPSKSRTTIDVNKTGIDMETGDEHIDMTPCGMVAWAASRMAEIGDYSGEGHGGVISYIDKILQDLGMEDLSKDLPGIVLSLGSVFQDDFTGDIDDVAESSEDGTPVESKDNPEGIDVDPEELLRSLMTSNKTI